jgi:hypothetical protein
LNHVGRLHVDVARIGGLVVADTQHSQFGHPSRLPGAEASRKRSARADRQVWREFRAAGESGACWREHPQRHSGNDSVREVMASWALRIAGSAWLALGSVVSEVCGSVRLACARIGQSR